MGLLRAVGLLGVVMDVVGLVIAFVFGVVSVAGGAVLIVTDVSGAVAGSLPDAIWVATGGFFVLVGLGALVAGLEETVRTAIGYLLDAFFSRRFGPDR